MTTCATITTRCSSCSNGINAMRMPCKRWKNWKRWWRRQPTGNPASAIWRRRNGKHYMRTVRSYSPGWDGSGKRTKPIAHGKPSGRHTPKTITWLSPTWWTGSGTTRWLKCTRRTKSSCMPTRIPSTTTWWRWSVRWRKPMRARGTINRHHGTMKHSPSWRTAWKHGNSKVLPSNWQRYMRRMNAKRNYMNRQSG